MHHTPSAPATLPLDAAVDIRKVQDLLSHRHLTTTQINDKRRLRFPLVVTRSSTATVLSGNMTSMRLLMVLRHLRIDT